MAAEDPIPTTIGRYAVKQLLGAGAMGSVYLAEDPNIKRRIAIKMVKKGLLIMDADRQEVFARFQREAEVSGLLNHPAIVAIYDFGESEAGTYLAMEFVEGKPLDEVIKSGEPLSLEARFRILHGIAEALDHAHSKGIVHRDVKPGNVMLGLDGRPKLMDFGIAKREDASLTQTGTFLGTPSYASPEQIREGVVDSRSDVFSFGVMAFELFAGRTPFPGSSINTILYKIVNEPPTMPDPPMEGVLPESWTRIFEQVLAKRPQDRYESCVAFVEDLRKAFSNLDAQAKSHMERPGHVATVPSLPSVSIDPYSHNLDATISTKRRKPSRLLALAGMGLGGLALGAVALVVVRQFKATPAPPVQAAPPGPEASLASRGLAAQPTSVPPSQPVTESGVVKLTGTFPVRVKLDGQDQGEWAPGKTVELPPGVHQFELANAKVFFKDSRAVEVKAKETVTLALPPTASITVFTYPMDGLVIIDGQLTRVASVAEESLTVSHGRHVFGIQGKNVKHTATIQGNGQVKFGPVTQ